MFVLPRSFRAAIPCALAAAALAAVPTTPAAAAEPSATSARGCANARVVPAATNLASVRRATICLLNRERSSRGLRKLRVHASLSAVSRRYARQMVRDGFFDHVSPGGSTMTSRVKASSYLRSVKRSWALGENLAWGMADLASPLAIVDAWMDSDGHRRNILDRDFREIGIGVVLGTPEGGRGGSGATYVTEFGLRR